MATAAWTRKEGKNPSGGTYPSSWIITTTKQ